MFRRIKNSWALFVRSMEVIGQNKRLLVFPLITFACTIVIVLFFVGGFILRPTGHAYSDKAHWKVVAETFFTAESLEAAQREAKGEDKESQLVLNPTGVAIVGFFYFFAMFLATFFNVAFSHEIIEGLKGRGVSVRRGFAFAMSRLKPILMWSLLAGAIGYLIAALEERLGFIGKLTVRLIGLAWSVAAVFAIPVIVCQEDTDSPFAVLRSSAQTIRKTWGESLTGYLGFSGVGFLVFLVSGGLMAAFIILAMAAGAPFVLPFVIAGWILFLFGFAYLSGVAARVYQCALYLYAATGIAPLGYSTDAMNGAWKRKT